MLPKFRTFSMLCAVSALAVPSSGFAQQPASPRGGALAAACRSDIDSMCSDAKGRERVTCLRAHDDKLSAPCKAELQKRAERRQQREQQNSKP